MTNNVVNVVDVIEFAESTQYLNLKLYPLQKFILKILFGVPLGDDRIQLWDAEKLNPYWEGTEVQYLKHAYDYGKCNIAHPDDVPAGGFGEAVIFNGRRSGKNILIAIAATYSLLKLLSQGNPQEYFYLVPGSPIDFTMISQDPESADRLLDIVGGFLTSASVFSPYLMNSPKWKSGLTTEYDRNKIDASPSIFIGSYPSNFSGIRGPSSIFLAFNEFAHMKNAENLYYAAIPATAQFYPVHTNAPPEFRPEPKVLSISSPWYKTGKMFELFERALDEGAKSDIFAFNESTANMNTNITAEALARMKKNSPKYFDAEFGGEFMVGRGA
jgi:hypothetical protein